MSAKMVDVTTKDISLREAEAEGVIKLRKETLQRILDGRIEKGDPIAIAKVAAIQAVKKTPDVLPLCHPISLTGVEVEHEVLDDGVKLKVRVRAMERTGVEMEALAGVSIGLLTIWDVVKKYEKNELGQYPDTAICGIKVVRKVKKNV